MRIYFATDIHGSQRCWAKFVNAARFYEADVLVMGGDFTGKMIVPLVAIGKSRFRCEGMGRPQEMHERDLPELERQIVDAGFYPYRTEPDEMASLQASRPDVDALFLRLMEERLKAWLDVALERLAPQGVRCFFAAGNDDPPEIDAMLDSYSAESDGCLVHCNERLVQLDDEHEMITLGTSNPTPWETPREEDESRLREAIDCLAGEVRSLDSAIFNLHVPPYQTRLDEAPELDSDFRPVTNGGQISMVPVGSTAVRECIEAYQPMLSLHGHIHESKGFARLGRTVCINPGSEYGDGVLDGAVVDIDGDDLNFSLVSG